MSQKINAAEQSFIAAVTEMVRSAATKAKAATLTFFALPLMDAAGINALQKSHTPLWMTEAKRACIIPEGTPADMADTMRTTAAEEAKKSLQPLFSAFRAITASKKPEVVKIRDAYAKGQYVAGLRETYDLARGASGSQGGGKGDKSPAEKLLSTLSKADADDVITAVVAWYDALDAETQERVILPLVAKSKANKK